MNMSIKLLIIAYIIISELLYIWLCRRNSKKEVKENWIGMKVTSFVVIAIASSLLFFVYMFAVIVGAKLSTNVIVVIVLFVLFFVFNKKIAMFFAGKGIKTKTKKANKKK